jgi:hypothetical protein
MIFLERDLQRSALHGRVEFKVAGQGGLVAAAARTQHPPNLLVSRFTFYVQLFATTLLFPNVASTHTHAYTHTRAHAHAHTHTSTHHWPSSGQNQNQCAGPIAFAIPSSRRIPCPLRAVLSGASSRQVAVIGPGRRSSHKSDRWACSPHVHTAPRRRPPPFLGTRRSCCWPALPNSASLLLRFSSLTRGGNSFPASGVFGPHPHLPLPSMSHHPMSQFVACSLWWFPVRSQRVHWCRLAVSPPRSGHHLLRVPALVPAPPNPPNPRSTQQPLKSLAAQCPRLITNQTHP